MLNLSNKLKRLINYIHKDILKYYKQKIIELKKNEILEIWYATDYYSNFPEPTDFVNQNSPNYHEQEFEISCYFILVSKQVSWIYDKEYRHYDDCIEYEKLGYSCYYADMNGIYLFDPESIITFQTSLILDLINERIKKEKPEFKIPRKLECQFEIFDMYKKIPNEINIDK